MLHVLLSAGVKAFVIYVKMNRAILNDHVEDGPFQSCHFLT